MRTPAIFNSALRTADSAVGIGLGTGAAVLGIYSHHLPNLTDIRMTEAHNQSVMSQRKSAAITSALLITTVFAITRDRNVLIIAGTAMIAADYTVRHANGVDPATNKLDAPTSGSIAPDMATPLPDYAAEDDYGADGAYM